MKKDFATLCPICIVEKQPDASEFVLLEDFYTKNLSKLEKLLQEFLKVKDLLEIHLKEFKFNPFLSQCEKILG